MRRSIMSIVAAALAGTGHPVEIAGVPNNYRRGIRHESSAPARQKQPTGHRKAGYKRTQADTWRVEVAAKRRELRAMKRARDYAKCIANNPCLA